MISFCRGGLALRSLLRQACLRSGRLNLSARCDGARTLHARITLEYCCKEAGL